MSATRFTRRAPDGAEECLTLLRLDDGMLWSEALGLETPYVVQVTACPCVGDDFVGICDLDGEKIDVSPRACKVATEAPADVVDVVETGWATGLLVVERLS